jgi:hypothetical protein
VRDTPVLADIRIVATEFVGVGWMNERQTARVLDDETRTSALQIRIVVRVQTIRSSANFNLSFA